MRKRLLASILMLFVVVSQGCGEGLAGAAQKLDQIASIAVTAQTLVRNLNAQGVNVLSNDEARPLMAGFRRVGEVGLVAVGVVRNLQNQPTVGAADNAEAAAVLKAVQDAVSELTVTGAIGIKNPTTQKQVRDLIGQLVQLTTTLVNGFVSQVGVTPERYLSEVAYASR